MRGRQDKRRQKNERGRTDEWADGRTDGREKLTNILTDGHRLPERRRRRRRTATAAADAHDVVKARRARRRVARGEHVTRAGRRR